MTNQEINTEKPRVLLRFWNWVRYGFKPKGRYSRYTGVITLAILIIWSPVVMYSLTAPASYTSGFTLILPGAGVGTSINLNDLGQATTATTSPYSSSTLSPTQKYKRLLMAERTQEIAANSLNIPLDEFSKPKITLIDQTELIIVELDGSTGANAQAMADALHTAFNNELERLRADETAEREKAQRVIIDQLQAKVTLARGQMLDFQADSGLLSEDQFSTRVTSLENMKIERLELSTKYARLEGELETLSDALGINVREATRAFILKSDSLFQDLLSRLSKVSGEMQELDMRFGSRHPTLVSVKSDYSGVLKAVEERGQILTGLSGARLMSLTDLTVSEHRANLFTQLIATEAERAGLAEQAKQLTRQITAQEKTISELAGDAAKLDTLGRDLQVAEAVFSSALARLDTNKSDIFASYPLAQTLEAAKVPENASGPKRLFAVAGGIAATFFFFIGLGLAWLRQPILAKLLPSD